MDFALTDDQVLIRDAAETIFAGVSDSAAVRKAMENACGYDRAVWQRLSAELGWCATAIDEAQGGLGLGAVELVLIQEQAGRHLLCAPFYSTACVGATLIQNIGLAEARDEYLPAIAAGELRVGLELPDTEERWIAAASAMTLRQTADGWRLDGAAQCVADGSEAELLLVFARVPEGGLGVFAVASSAAGVERRGLDGWDRTRRFAAVSFRDAPARRIDDPQRVDEGVARSVALARLYLAAEQLGGAQACLDMSVAYLGTRKQFGRVLAGFQALKHRCAEMMVRIEALRSAVYGAAASAVATADAQALGMECAAASLLARETYFWCAQEAIQLHGGVGFTWEFDPQLHYKRAQAGSHWLGSADVLRGEIAAVLLD